MYLLCGNRTLTWHNASEVAGHQYITEQHQPAGLMLLQWADIVMNNGMHAFQHVPSGPAALQTQIILNTYSQSK